MAVMAAFLGSTRPGHTPDIRTGSSFVRGVWVGFKKNFLQLRFVLFEAYESFLFFKLQP